MQAISFIGESHSRVENYGVSDLIESIVSFKPSRVIVTMDGNTSNSSGYNDALSEVTGSPEISSKIVQANVDETRYYSMREEFYRKYLSSAEDVVRKNILDMIDATVKSYLEGYWKNYETVNSEVTDSLFRAKHKMISTMFWEMEKQTWNQMLQEMTSKIRGLNAGAGDVIVVDVERRYWILDNLLPP